MPQTSTPVPGGDRWRSVRSACEWLSLGALASFSVGLLYFAFFGSRMAFLRGATFTLNAAPERYALRADPAPSEAPLNVVTSIPPPPMDSPWWHPAAIVDPDALVEYTLGQGAGNCAAKSRGLGWWLHMRGVPFRFVYLMRDPEIRDGDGHTMVESTWLHEGHAVTGLLDPLAAGVPMADGIPLTSERLIEERSRLRVRYEPDRIDLVEMRELGIPVAESDESDRTIFVGYSAGSEVVRHLEFMKLLSHLLPDSFVARTTGMAASLFLGIYPAVYVPVSQTTPLSSTLRMDIVVASVTLWSARAALAFGVLILLTRSFGHKAGVRSITDSSSRAPSA